jgi:replicative DNA helicase
MTTNRSEDTLYSSLTDVEALEQLVKISLPLECIPTPAMRDVVSWAVSYFEKSGQSKAPSREALMETWGQVIEDAEVEIEESDVELEEIGWAIDALKAKYADWKFQSWQKEAAAALSESNTTTRLSVMEEQVHVLNQMILSLRDKTQEVEGMDGFARALAAYERRAEKAQQHRGLAFGIEPIDEYTYGIHEGELAVLAAGPKTGKSVAFAYILLQEWKKGRHVTLNTLENSVDMTYDRLVCIHLHVDHDRWRKGLCSPDEVDRVRTFIHEKLDDMKELIHVIQPQRGQRTVEHMTRHARAIGTQSLLLDQLTFMEASDRRLRGPEKITDIMHDLKDAIGGRLSIPCLLAHQINREGMREAKKNGWLEMYMLAEGSEVERTADWVFGLYASPDERQAQMIKIQTLATRRGSTNMNWRAGVWRPWVNQVDALEEITEPRG